MSKLNESSSGLFLGDLPKPLPKPKNKEEE